jgi:hypothetical protein
MLGFGNGESPFLQGWFSARGTSTKKPVQFNTRGDSGQSFADATKKPLQPGTWLCF